MDKQKFAQNKLDQLYRIWLGRGCLLGAVFFLFLGGIDCVRSPENADLLLYFRFGAAGILLTIYFLHKRTTSIKAAYVLGLIAVFCMAAAIEPGILRTGGDGVSSAAFFTLSILVIGGMPARLSFHIIAAGIIYSVRFLPHATMNSIAVVGGPYSHPGVTGAFLGTVLILRILHHRNVLREIMAHHEVEHYSTKLEMIIQNRGSNLSNTIKMLKNEISERKRFEDDLTNASQDWRKTFDSIKDIIMMLDAGFHVVKINRAGSVFFKKSYQEILGESVYVLIGKPVPDDDLLVKMMNTKEHCEEERLMTDRRLWISVSVAPILNDREQVTGAVLIMKDMTDIKKMQDSIITTKNEWEDTFHTITDMITVHDMNFNIIRANKAAERLLDLPEMNTGSMLKCYRYYHGADSPPARCYCCESLKNGKFATFERYEPYLNMFVEIRAIPRFNSSGELIGLIHIVRDITEIKTHEDEKGKLREQLFHVQKLESIGRLAGAVAHDFNNIMSVITGFSELALKELPHGSAMWENIDAIRAAGEKASAITGELLAFSRKQVLTMKVVNFNVIIENMKTMLGRLIGEHIMLAVDTGRECSNMLADPIQIEQIILNLAINARDAMPGGGSLTIRTSDEVLDYEYVMDDVHMPPGPYVTLSMKDTGVGMSSDVQEKIFEPFFTTKDVGKGTGMGLATVYGIVKQHRGHITVQSEEGEGAEFKIYFPMDGGELEGPDTTAAEEIPEGNETILVVDDEPLLLKVIANILTPLGYRVLQASCGKDALQLSDNFKERIDLLLTDVIMPEMNGKELADMLHQRRPDTKIIFISGYTDDTLNNYGVLGRDIVLVHKPLREKVLAGRIREVLNGDHNPSELPSEVTMPRPLNILLVDDNKDIRRLVEIYLKDYACKIDTAENGKRAIEQFQKAPYDVVLMDMQMPVIDGTTATREIRKWEQDRGLQSTPIIALTGSSSQDECFEAGCTSYVAKPIKREQLVSALLLQPSAQDSCRLKGQAGQEEVVAYIDEELMDIIPDYFERRNDDIRAMKKALSESDYDTIRQLGHSMKGSGGGYGFDIITDIGFQLEKAASEKKSEEIHSLIARLSDYMNNVRIVSA